jgi:hypothetical protein
MMPHPDETRRDGAAEYAEARRVWQVAREVALGRARRDTVSFRSYGAARDALVGELLGDAAAHDEGRFDDIGHRAGRMELPRVGPPELRKLRVALSFWDGWIDARNRGWQPHGNIAKAEWPLLARRVASDLAEEREISDARVAGRFDVSNSQSHS